MAAVEIARTELDAAQLRAEAGRSSDSRQKRRILAVAMVLDGSAGVARQGASLQR